MSSPNPPNPSDLTSAAVLLVNIGATRIRTAVTLPGEEVSRGITNQAVGATLDEVLRQISAIHFGHHAAIGSVAVACPGLVAPDGSVGPALHSAVSNSNLGGILSRELDAPVIVVNDAYAQAEGVDIGNRDALFVSLGTAVGGAVMRAGRVVRSQRGHGGEVGHLPTGIPGQPCACGRRSCLDLVSSGWSIERDLGDEWWLRPAGEWRSRVAEAGHAIGEVSAQVQPLLDHELLVIGGCLTNYVEFREAVKEATSVASLWLRPDVRFITDLDDLTWTGLRQIVARSQ